MDVPLSESWQSRWRQEQTLSLMASSKQQIAAQADIKKATAPR
jgi:hypothetical protein